MIFDFSVLGRPKKTRKVLFRQRLSQRRLLALWFPGSTRCTSSRSSISSHWVAVTRYAQCFSSIFDSSSPLVHLRHHCSRGKLGRHCSKFHYREMSCLGSSKRLSECIGMKTWMYLCIKATNTAIPRTQICSWMYCVLRPPMPRTQICLSGAEKWQSFKGTKLAEFRQIWSKLHDDAARSKYQFLTILLYISSTQKPNKWVQSILIISQDTATK